MTREMNNSSDAAASPRMAGRTPGTWNFYWKYDRSTAEADCGIYGDRNTLGHAYAVARCPRHQTRAQWEADARLICAAPDYDASAREIDRLLLVIESAVRTADPGNYAAVMAALDANRATITKATKGPAPAAEPNSSEHP